jgi:hypothetical protein
MSHLTLRASILALTLSLLAPLVRAETADDVIARNIAARGGIEKIQSLKSIRTGGKLIIGDGQMEGQLMAEVKRPNISRVDFTIGGMEGFRVWDGTQGWGTSPWAGVMEPALLKGNELKDSQEQADIEGPLVNYKAKGHSVELVGKEKWGETDCDKLKITLKNGDVAEVYIDSKTNLEAGQRLFRDGEPYMEMTMSDWKQFDGLMMAQQIDIVPHMEGAPPSHVFIEHVEINPEIDDARFARPDNLPAAPAPATKP